MMALPRAAPPNWPDVEAPPIVRLGKCQGETKREALQRQQAAVHNTLMHSDEFLSNTISY